MPHAPAVLSFMSQWGGNAHLQKQPPSNAGSPGPASPAPLSPSNPPPSSFAQSATALDNFNSGRASPSPNHQRAFSNDSRPSSRPMSMIQTYQPPSFNASLHFSTVIPTSCTRRAISSSSTTRMPVRQNRHTVPHGDTDSMQVAAPLPTANGRNTSFNSSVPFFRYGMLAHSIKQVATWRCYQPSLTSRMLQSTW
jgi:hypothetical protein